MVVASFSIEQLRDPDGDVLAALDATLCDPGALRVVGDAHDRALLAEIDAVTRTFFALPLDDKAALRYEADPYVGWCGDRYLAESGSSDHKEMFHIGPRVAPTLAAHDADGSIGPGRPGEAAQGCALWPQDEAFVEVWHRYYRSMQALAATLGRVLAGLLGVAEADWFAVMGGNWADLAANYYPPLPEETAGEPVYNAAHCDLTVFTVLYQDDNRVGGLSVQSADGGWSPVTPEPGTYVVNVGELLTELSGGRWRAAPHRVTVDPAAGPQGKARISIPFFYRPSDDRTVRSFVDPTAAAIGVGEWVALRKRRSLAAAE